jgi:hypothetical protein
VVIGRKSERTHPLNAGARLGDIGRRIRLYTACVPIVHQASVYNRWVLGRASRQMARGSLLATAPYSRFEIADWEACGKSCTQVSLGSLPPRHHPPIVHRGHQAPSGEARGRSASITPQSVRLSPLSDDRRSTVACPEPPSAGCRSPKDR